MNLTIRHRTLGSAIATFLALAGCGGSSSTDPQHDLSGALHGTGTATVDGVLAPGEWDQAARIDLAVNVPSNDGGGTVPATLRVMDDGAKLYVALEVGRAFGAGQVGVAVFFDANFDGQAGVGDDYFGGDESVSAVTHFTDGYYVDCPGAPPGTTLCAPADTNGLGGLQPVGTIDGGIGTAGGATTTVLEVWHPLRSGDPHDVSLRRWDAIGVNFSLQLSSNDLVCSSGPACIADTRWPTSGSLKFVATGG